MQQMLHFANLTKQKNQNQNTTTKVSKKSNTVFGWGCLFGSLDSISLIPLLLYFGFDFFAL